MTGSIYGRFSVPTCSGGLPMISHSASPISVPLYGEPRSPSPTFSGQTGRFSFVFESGMLKHLCIGGVEVAHRIYFAVRDEKWATVRNEISEVELSEVNDVFEAAWSGRCRSTEVDFEWQGRIRILANGLIEFRVNGTALKTFKTPRIGLCLLLSTDWTLGKAFEVTSSEGRAQNLRFETIFKRTQLACRWRSLKLSPAPNLKVEYTIDGAYFDLEDQRNFGDVSYKAMAGMPLKDHQVLAGTKSEQVLTIRVDSTPGLRGRMSRDNLLELRAEPEVASGVMPQIGVSLGDLETDRSLLSAISDVKVFWHDWFDCSSTSLESHADHLAAVALKLNRPVYLTLEHLSSDNLPQTAELLSRLQELGVRFLQIDIPESAHPGLMLLRTCAREARLNVPCGKRVSSFKDRAGLLEAANSGADFLAWCGTPLCHQDDDETLLENAAVFSHQALTAKTFAPEARLTIGPIQLSQEGCDPDPRCRGLIAAAFMASSVQSMAQGIVDHALLCAVKSLVNHSERFAGPSAAPERKGEILPSYYAIRHLSSFVGNRTFTVKSSRPLQVRAFGVSSGEGEVVTIINQTPETQRVCLSGIFSHARHLQLRALNESTYSELASPSHCPASNLPEDRVGSLVAPLVISPFSVNFLKESPS